MVEKISPFKERLKEALEIKNIRPVDLCKLTKISQSTMSQYLSGYAEPKKERLSLIAKKLNVNPTWLMGLDEPMEISSQDGILPEVDPDIRRIERARNNMSPKDKSRMMAILKASFEEYFDDDFIDDDTND